MKLSRRAAGFFILLLSLAFAPASIVAGLPAPAAGVAHRDFGSASDGKMGTLYTLTNKHGMEVSITDFGATVVSIKVPDRDGKLGDVVLGYDDVAGYEKGTESFGATVGRYANRIAHGTFSLDGTAYTLFKNNGENTLHGGKIGFNKKWWTAKDLSANGSPAVQFEYLSKDGEEGFPGNLSVQVTFTLTNDNALQIVYHATTDKKTVLNLTNHSYFNLAGSGTILDEKVMIAASQFTPVDAGMIPTSELRAVQGTPFDFRTPTIVGERINQEEEQLKLGRGYDHNWILDANSKKPANPTLAASVWDPRSGRKLEVWTTEPGIQLYTGNFLDGTVHGKGGTVYVMRSALCLETQHYPDSPNHPSFPTTELKPGETFHSETIFKFATAKSGEDKPRLSNY
jgi:aldose 1-epimerase